MTRIEAFALTLSVFTLVSSAGAALAQEDYSRTGPYLGIEGSVGVPRQLQDSVEVLSIGPKLFGALEGLDVDPSIGIHARAGWRLHPRLAAEAHFEYLDEFNISAGDGQRAFPSRSADLGSVSSWTLTGDLNAYLLTGRIQPFLSAGAGVMNVDTKDRRETQANQQVVLGFPGDGTAFALRMGGGIDWYLNEYVAFSLNASYVLPTGSLDDYDYFSVGFGLRIPFWWLMPGAENGEDVAAATRQSAPGAPPTERFASAAELFDEPYYWPTRARRRPEPVQIAALDDWQMVANERSEATNWLLSEEPVTTPVTVLAQQSAAEDEQVPDPGPAPTEIEEPESDISLDIEEILVQGEKSQGTLASDAAMSQVVFSPEDLKAERITDISDLAEYTPNLEINKGFAASGATIFIRGIGLNDFNANASSSGAVYVDGVYMNSPVGQLFQFFDTQGVEVLRGPQGSLFGRNATAGAILVTSRVPDGTFNAYSNFTYGNFNTIEVEGAVGVPIVSDVLSGRFAFRYAIRDGITKNRCGTNPNGDIATEGIAGQCSRDRREFFSGPVPEGLPKEVNAVDVWAARGILLFEPTPDQEWIFNVHGGQNRGDAAQLQNRGFENPVRNGTGEDDLEYRDVDRDPFAGDYDVVEPEYLDLFGTNLRGEIEIDDFSLTSISGFESNERSIFDNTDASPHVLIHSDLHDEAWQASQELRLKSYLGEDFNWTAGAYFLYEELEADNSFNTRDVIVNRQVYDQQLVTWAAYGNFTYQLMDRPCGPVLCWFELEGGVRYNWEQKSFNITATSGPINGSRADQIAQSETEIWDAVTGDAILRWRFFEDASIYAKYSRGFKGGHFNGGAFLSAQVVEAVDPESVDSYEIGVRSSWADGQLTLNFTAFYYDYTDYQVFTLQNNIGALPLPQLLNAPKVESKGIEVELGVTPTEGLNIDLSFALLDAEFTDFEVTRSFFTPPCSGGGRLCTIRTETQDFTGNELPGATPVQFTARASYELLLGRYGTLVPRVSANYKGRTYFDAGDVRGDEPVPNEGASQDPYWLFNAGLEYRTPDGHFTVSGWVRNITDQVYLQNSFDLREGFGMLLDFYGDPRTYGITIGVEF